MPAPFGLVGHPPTFGPDKDMKTKATNPESQRAPNPSEEPPQNHRPGRVFPTKLEQNPLEFAPQAPHEHVAPCPSKMGSGEASEGGGCEFGGCRSLRNDNKISDNRICELSKFIVMELPRKKRVFGTHFPEISPSPTPSKMQNLLTLSFRHL